MSQVIVLPKMSNKRKYTESMGSSIIQRNVRRRFARRSTVASANRIPRTMRDFPKEMRVKLKYSYCRDFTVGSGPNPNFVAFRANSVHDPEAAIGGGVPTGFAQWSNFYTQYTVVKSSCKMRMLDQNTDSTTTGTFNGLMGISVRDSASPVPVPSQEALITDSDSNYRANSSYTPDDRVSLYWNASKYFGIKDILDNTELSGLTGTLVGTSPSRQAYYLVWGNQRTTGGAPSQLCTLEVLLEYDVVFRQPADIA